jgi:hypothetical protein
MLEHYKKIPETCVNIIITILDKLPISNQLLGKTIRQLHLIFLLRFSIIAIITYNIKTLESLFIFFCLMLGICTFFGDNLFTIIENYLLEDDVSILDGLIDRINMKQTKQIRNRLYISILISILIIISIKYRYLSNSHHFF